MGGRAASSRKFLAFGTGPCMSPMELRGNLGQCGLGSVQCAMVGPVEGAGKELSSGHQELTACAKLLQVHGLEGQAMPSW